MANRTSPNPSAESRTEPSRSQEPRTARGPDDGALGAHKPGTVVGGVAGVVAGAAAVGSVAGPLGAAVGAGIGAVAGAYAGKGIADLINPTYEDEFWRASWKDRPYIEGGFTYDQDYGPAYRYGVDAYLRNPERHYDEIEPELSSGWAQSRSGSRLEWDKARAPARDAWDRADRQVRDARAPGASPGDRT
jgi:hypothetical protein